VVFTHRETLLRLVLLLAGEVRHPARRRLLRRLRRSMGLPPMPPPRQRRVTVDFLAAHLADDGCLWGLGPGSRYPQLTAASKDALLPNLWRQRYGGRVTPTRQKRPNGKPMGYNWYLTNSYAQLVVIGELRVVYHRWSAEREWRLALFPLALALRACGAFRRTSPLFPY